MVIRNFACPDPHSTLPPVHYGGTAPIGKRPLIEARRQRIVVAGRSIQVIDGLAVAVYMYVNVDFDLQ